MKITFAVYMRNNGDGSGSPMFFRDEASAEKYAENHDERMCEDIEMHTIEVDANGQLVMDDEEKDKAQELAWDNREKAEKAYKKEKNAVKKTQLKEQFKTADIAWRELL